MVQLKREFMQQQIITPHIVKIMKAIQCTKSMKPGDTEVNSFPAFFQFDLLDDFRREVRQLSQDAPANTSSKTCFELMYTKVNRLFIIPTMTLLEDLQFFVPSKRDYTIRRLRQEAKKKWKLLDHDVERLDRLARELFAERIKLPAHLTADLKIAWETELPMSNDLDRRRFPGIREIHQVDHSNPKHPEFRHLSENWFKYVDCLGGLVGNSILAEVAFARFARLQMDPQARRRSEEESLSRVQVWFNSQKVPDEWLERSKNHTKKKAEVAKRNREEEEEETHADLVQGGKVQGPALQEDLKHDLDSDLLRLGDVAEEVDATPPGVATTTAGGESDRRTDFIDLLGVDDHAVNQLLEEDEAVHNSVVATKPNDVLGGAVAALGAEVDERRRQQVAPEQPAGTFTTIGTNAILVGGALDAAAQGHGALASQLASAINN